MEVDDSLRQLFVESCRSHDTAEKPDEVNFRFYLWKSMHLFPQLCEKKNRDVVPLFFDFIRFVWIHNWLLKFCVETSCWHLPDTSYPGIIVQWIHLCSWTSIFVYFRKINSFIDILIHGQHSDRCHLSCFDRHLILLPSLTKSTEIGPQWILMKAQYLYHQNFSYFVFWYRFSTCTYTVQLS